MTNTDAAPGTEWSTPLGATALPGQRREPGDELRLRAERCLDRAVGHLLDRQEGAGWWRGLLETNVTMDAEDLMMRQFLGVRTDEQTAASARHIRAQQRADGSWANFYDGPADPSTTAEAYVALRLAGDDPQDPHMQKARQVVHDHGGLEETRVFTRIWLALFGQWDWDELPAMPPELVFLPSWFPLNLYDFACWARQTIAPLTVLGALRPARDLGVNVDELRLTHRYRHAERAGRWGTTQAGRWGTTRAVDVPTSVGAAPSERAFALLDQALHGYEHLALKPGRRAALRRTIRWIVDRQEADGSWGGIQPPWVYSLMALHAFGYPLDHPVLRRGLDGWERFTVMGESEQGPTRWVEACQSPVWDTALAMIGLGDAGLAGDHPAMSRARDWILSEEIGASGDWAVRRPRTTPGGWAFEFDNDLYPDIDDTAEVVLALRRATPGQDADAAIGRGLDWLAGMQSRDGGWGAFDADNTRQLAYRLPFCDFGAVIDPPSADVTAHVVEMLAGEHGADDPAVRRGLRWLLDAQESDGSWFGRWGANHVYGTGAVVPALVKAGLPVHDPVITRAVSWLNATQNPDGGWGEDLRSYADPSWVGRGESTASQTAWALLALHAAGQARSTSARRGIAWLVDTQQEDGGWDEPQFTGTGFPGDFYINYHLYRVVFPLSALGRCLDRTPGSIPAAGLEQPEIPSVRRSP
ncbi:MAG TPA: squalene--hopene cyclase [Nocardioidaceae bacterium]|nr:squalene--hopene cyclase [Nocardioidaceae bacterium]